MSVTGVGYLKQYERRIFSTYHTLFACMVASGSDLPYLPPEIRKMLFDINVKHIRAILPTQIISRSVFTSLHTYRNRFLPDRILLAMIHNMPPRRVKILHKDEETNFIVYVKGGLEMSVSSADFVSLDVIKSLKTKRKGKYVGGPDQPDLEEVDLDKIPKFMKNFVSNKVVDDIFMDKKRQKDISLTTPMLRYSADDWRVSYMA